MTTPLKVSINPAATKNLKLRVALPPAGAGLPPGNFFLLVRLTSATSPLTDLNVTDGNFLPAIPLTVV